MTFKFAQLLFQLVNTHIKINQNIVPKRRFQLNVAFFNQLKNYGSNWFDKESQFGSFQASEFKLSL